MKSISLTKVSLLVVAASMASFFTKANETTAQLISQNMTHVESSVVNNVEEPVTKRGDRFTFTSLDTDRNGRLNHQEVIAGNNEWLMQSFTKIDVNTDRSLTEQELVEFVTRSNVIIQ